MNTLSLKLALILVLFTNIAWSQSIVESSVDGKKLEKTYLNIEGLIVKSIHYNPENKKTDTLSYTYFEDRIGKISLKGDGDVIGFDEDILKNRLNNVKWNMEVLGKYGATYPLPYINSMELSDMVSILTSVDKTKIKRQGNSLIVDSISLKVRFGPSHIESYIPGELRIYKYFINFIGKLPAKEEVWFEGGKLTRTYHYENQKLLKIVWECKYDDEKKLYGETKTFSYE